MNFRDHLIAAPLKLSHGDRLHPDSRQFPRSSDRGPIEALERMAGRWSEVDFRDHLIAAPLKRMNVDVRGRIYVYFRDHLIAAPLKPN